MLRRILAIGALTVSLIAVSISVATPVRASAGFADNTTQSVADAGANDGEVPLSRALSPTTNLRVDSPLQDVHSLKASLAQVTYIRQHRRDPVDFAKFALHRYGWTDRAQFGCLYKLWMRESGWDKHARNPYSGAYGIPQALPGWKMASAGANWMNNARVQIHWGLHYIKVVYGTPCRAWGNEMAIGSYSISASPLRGIKSLVWGRVDEGVDFTGSGYLHAVSRGIIDCLYGGWPGVYILEHVTSGPAAGRFIYFAEGISPQVSVGQYVNSNTVLGYMSPYVGNGSIEIGWGTPVCGEALGHPGYIDGYPTPAGYSMLSFLRKLRL